ncbi:hypothetical protein QQF64_021281 [Cirrhinus molitorella]|uniref:Uncharacterized protein n=1 Tax=Cirrhinus molitorella TaxID=172907 RepID=A0ABR3LDW3_9TELE
MISVTYGTVLRGHGRSCSGGLGKGGGDMGRDGFEGTQSQMKTRPGEKERGKEEEVGTGGGRKRDGKALLWLAMGVCLSAELLP